MLRNAFVILTLVALNAQAFASAKVQLLALPEPGIATGALKKEDKILAQVADRPVFESEFELFLSLVLNPQQRMQIGNVQGGKDPYRKQFLDTKVMQAAARKQGLDKKPDFRPKMDHMEMQVLVQALLERDGVALRSEITVDEMDAKAYFEKHQNQFKIPESYTARHILVALRASNAPKNAKGWTEDEAKARIALAARALADGRGWEVVAKEFSDDPGSKEKGGLYERIAYGSFAPEFEEAVRKQQLAHVGAPVKTKYGWHLILVEKRIAAEEPLFEMVKEKVQQNIKAAKQEEIFQSYIDGLKKDVGFEEGEAKIQDNSNFSGRSSALASGRIDDDTNIVQMAVSEGSKIWKNSGIIGLEDYCKNLYYKLSKNFARSKALKCIAVDMFGCMLDNAAVNEMNFPRNKYFNKEELQKRLMTIFKKQNKELDYVNELIAICEKNVPNEMKILAKSSH